MNTTALTLTRRRSVPWGRIHGLYNGVGYVLVLGLVLGVLGGLKGGAPQLLAGHPLAFLSAFLGLQWRNFLEGLIGLLLIPPVVNLAPRAGGLRFGVLVATTVVLFWWCLVVVEGVRFGWNWPSLGFVLDGFLSAGLVTGVCAYHIDSRAAADVLLHSRIQRAGLDAELQRARLRLLTAQVEPHFLFNTLSVVRALGRTDRSATVDMLDNLVRYFQAAAPRLRANAVPLAQELELVAAYLAICRARMGERLDYRVAEPGDAGEVRIPTMVLLTLVENALKHGVAPLVEGGFIRVGVRREADFLTLEVADSGRGMDVRLGHGMGLANIRQRLLLTYGSAAVLSLRPAQPRGVVAGIRLPLLPP